MCFKWEMDVFKKKLLILILAVLVVPAVYAKVLKFGMSAALTGSAGSLGMQMKMGIEAYFQRINRAGGVNGNTLKLVAFDDRYEPYLSKRNVLRMVADKDILAIIGNVGTPTAIVSVPIVKEGKILLFGTLSGAKILREVPVSRYIINYRASYAREAEVIVTALLNSGIKPDEMAFFTQDDSYGNAGYFGIVRALQYAGYSKKVINKIPHGRYTHNTTEIEEGLNEIIKHRKDIKAFIIVGAYQPVAKFIVQAKQYYPDAYYLNVSFVGSEALLNELCKQNHVLCVEFSRNIIITQVVPYYYSKLPAAREFIQDLRKAFPHAKPSFVAFEGYIVARLLVAGLRKTGPHPTRENIIDALESLNKVDIGLGFPIFLSKTNHQATDKVWPTIFEIMNSRVIIRPMPMFKLKRR